MSENTALLEKPQVKTPRKRYESLDTLRGIALLNMIAYHFLYDLVCIAGIYMPFFYGNGAHIWQQCICITFIAISGAVCIFSRSLWKRGLLVFAGGLLITLVTYLAAPDELVVWGVLSLIGAAMLITHFIKPLLMKINPYVGASVSLLLFILLRHVPSRCISFFSITLFRLPDVLYDSTSFLFPLGFPDSAFFSTDYFALIPWIFLFWFGFFAFRVIEKHDCKALHIKCKPLAFLGRHSFIIYLAHQPVLFGITMLITLLMPAAPVTY